MAGNEHSLLRKTFPFGEVMSKLIQITDVLETKLRKEKELEFYKQELKRLQQKMFFVQKDIDITNVIIKIIENESVYDIKQNMIEKGDE